MVLPGKYRTGRQQDIHEFKTFLFDVLDKHRFVAPSAVAPSGAMSVSSSTASTGSHVVHTGAGASAGAIAGAGASSDADTPPQMSVIKELFGGTQATVMRCVTCSHSTCRVDSFVELNVGFPRRFTPITDIIAIVVPRCVEYPVLCNRCLRR